MTELGCTFLRVADSSFASATDRFEKLVAGLDDDRANWRPDPHSWSVAACIDHLTEASRTYFAKLEPALTRAREQGRTGSHPYGRGTLVGRFLLGVLDPDRPDFKAVAAPRVFRPRTGDLHLSDVCGRFRSAQETWHDLLRRADGLDLGRIRLATPVSPLLRLSAAQAIQVHVWHHPRHLSQAERLMQLPEFPE